MKRTIKEKLENAVALFNKNTITDKDTLQSEVDLISKETGWSKDEILKLPVIRRKSYVSLIQAQENN